MDLSNRINKKGDNCNIGDIVTWNMSKNREQLFGIVKEKHPTCIYVDLLKYSIYNHNLYLTKIKKIDNVCFNKLQLLTRKIMIIKSV